MYKIFSRFPGALFTASHFQQIRSRRFGQNIALIAVAMATTGMSLPTPATVQMADESPAAMPAAATAPAATSTEADANPAEPPSSATPPIAYQHGYAGVVGKLFAGGDLSCGGVYKPAEKVIFSATLPCGTSVRLYNRPPSSPPMPPW